MYYCSLQFVLGAFQKLIVSLCPILHDGEDVSKKLMLSLFRNLDDVWCHCRRCKKCKRDGQVLDTVASYGLEDRLRVQAHGAGYDCKYNVDVRAERVSQPNLHLHRTLGTWPFNCGVREFVKALGDDNETSYLKKASEKAFTSQEQLEAVNKHYVYDMEWEQLYQVTEMFFMDTPMSEVCLQV